jgi:hypothetical protein
MEEDHILFYEPQINYITNQFDLQIPHQLFAQQPTLANYSIQLHRRSELSTWFRQHDK